MGDIPDWRDWHQERKNFSHRDSEGFSKELEALEQHIINLTALCPRDEANWPAGDARIIIDRLKKDQARFKEYLALNQPVK